MKQIVIIEDLPTVLLLLPLMLTMKLQTSTASICPPEKKLQCWTCNTASCPDDCFNTGNFKSCSQPNMICESRYFIHSTDLTLMSISMGCQNTNVEYTRHPDQVNCALRGVVFPNMKYIDCSSCSYNGSRCVGNDSQSEVNQDLLNKARDDVKVKIAMFQHRISPSRNMDLQNISLKTSQSMLYRNPIHADISKKLTNSQKSQLKSRKRRAVVSSLLPVPHQLIKPYKQPYLKNDNNQPRETEKPYTEQDISKLVPKSGQCPAVPLINCFRKGDDLCHSDAECTGTMKCCPEGCGGTMCQEAEPVVKNGSCPALDGRLVKCAFFNGSQCTCDDGCPHNQKCCKTYCQGFQCTKPAPCNPVTCKMLCQYGWQKDENGCDICKCYDPCENVYCESNSKCEVQSTNASYERPKGVCKPIRKCSPFICFMFCEFGFVKDKFGCDICKCHYPCENFTCEIGFHCKVQSVEPPEYSTNDPKHIGVCVPNEVTCSPVTCLMFCQYGWEKDSNGCDICQCYDPCEHVSCPTNSRCEVPAVNGTDHALGERPNGICIPLKKCSQAMCLMFCEYGFVKDQYGCNICKCYNPCENFTCEVFSQCKVQSIVEPAEYSTNGYKHKGVCVPTAVKCSPVRCMMFCQYGWKKDNNGCDICQCYDPCENVYCGPNSLCEIPSINGSESTLGKRPKGICRPLIPAQCTCSVHGDPIVERFGGDREAIIEPGQHFLTTSGDDRKTPSGVEGVNYLSVYLVMEQREPDLYPALMYIKRLTVLFENDTVIMDGQKVKINSRFETPLPYTRLHHFTVTSHTGPSVTFKFESDSGIIVTFTPVANDVKVKVFVPSHVISKSPDGLCQTCPR